MTTPAQAPPPGMADVRRMATGRLGQGELRRQVAAHLAAHPAGQFTAGDIARVLDRSSGAVGNALDTLTDRGQAEKTSLRPRRYRATATTPDATMPAPPRHPASTAPTSPTGAVPTAPAGGGTPAPSSPSSPHPTPVSATGGGSGPVRRPNGQTYHPRLLADLPDVAALRRLRDAQIPALLYGPPGTGKTSLVEAAFPDLITVAGDGDTSVADFVGEYTQTSAGGYEFGYGRW